MEDNENRERQFAGDGQVLDSSLGDPEVTHEQEGSSIAVRPVDENKHPGETEDNELDQREAIDESLVQNGAENENLVEDEREPVKEAYQVGEEPLVNVPDEPNDDQDVSKGMEVMGNRDAGVDANPEHQHDPVTPNSLMRCSNGKPDDDSKGTSKDWLGSPMLEDDETGTPEEQAAFMKELECFYRERAMDFKPPKFYQQPLNLLKLWRAVIKLGGYDLVTGTKLWRQVGESFHPPKTCTTVSWTFRIFYEKALLEYERYKSQSGELQLAAVQPEFSIVDNEANGFQAPGSSGRVRRDSAARAMQGWHTQRLFSHGDGGEPIVKDKNNNMPKREKSLKSIGSLKQKRHAEVEHTLKAVRTETGKQVVATVEDAGPPADWVKINVREDKDCFEVYALVPGLLREEVRVQSDPVGRLVITGQPEQLDNPWGITAFRKVVNLPARIDPLQTSAVVSLHGRLYVRVPFEQLDI